MLILEMKKLSIEINSDALEENAAEIELIGKNIEDIFERVDSIMERLYDSDTWSGETNESFYNRYLQLKTYFPKINSGIQKYVKYIRTTSGNYKNAELIINNDVDSNIVSLDVNS